MDFLIRRVWMKVLWLSVHQTVLLWNHRLCPDLWSRFLWTYMKVVRNYRVRGRSTGMKSNSCSSLDINAIVCSTYTAAAAAATYLTLYRVLFESVVVCMFSDSNNRMQEHKKCNASLLIHKLMQFKWIYRLLDDRDFKAKYFRHEIHGGDSDARGSKDR